MKNVSDSNLDLYVNRSITYPPGIPICTGSKYLSKVCVHDKLMEASTQLYYHVPTPNKSY